MEASGAQSDLAAELRGQITERVRSQHQLILVAVAILGAIFSFQTRTVGLNSDMLATLSILYVGIALAILRQDQEITVIAEHLMDEEAFGPHASAQRRWEVHRGQQTQGKLVSFVVTAATTVGIYGVPVLGGVAFAVASVTDGIDVLSICLLMFSLTMLLIFFSGALVVRRRYKELSVT